MKEPSPEKEAQAVAEKAIAVQVKKKGVTKENGPSVDLGDRGSAPMARS